MENQSHHHQLRQSQQSFWKKNTRAVPGRPSPKQDIKQNRTGYATNLQVGTVGGNAGSGGGSGGSGGATSFQDFQESVDDAWDSGDDEFCTVSNVKISKKVSHSAALTVINSHRSGGSCKNLQTNSKETQRRHEIIPEEKKTEALQRLAVQPLHLRNVNLGKPQLQSNHNQHLAEEPELKSGVSPYHKPSQFPGRPQPLRQQSTQTKFFVPFKEQDGESKVDKFQSLLESPLLNLDELRQLSWSGVPVKLRSITWRLLSEYLPASLERRQPVLERKRLDYLNLVKQYYDAERDEGFQDTYRQIHIDIPRMSPLIALFQQTTVQLIFERILYIWAIRHPASGYVQGMNDLVTPFFLVFLQEAVPVSAWQDLENYDVASLPKEQRDIIEADSFWCLSKFLDGIQDNYIFAQLGIQHKVNQLKELIQRIDAPLHQHLHQHGVDYLQFSFRWMNNLLTREIPLHCTIRLWDTYLAESDRFASFQLYVCAAFLLRWKRHLLLQPDFQGLMLMLQNLPTQNWTDSEIGILVAEAYKLKFTFADAPNHLQAYDSR
ncbi:TBC1 domain family member 22B [Orussus abietinus]|uniref:TBC1 domain family member 22B n=1 Tax=Orussus abietinus TaxID=222816 RepID=UPI00062500B2|nr:TBC1 domain family member 22B [Orussus abietinus]XP_012280438.1 TBC1 domain family member 22B [Orussus abietinus]XP_012280439.1 TBC1 domain family member 22B [Orussus abietinus]XP_012280440.1 TBC1 domain family member 22B [Orussus abietinus]